MSEAQAVHWTPTQARILAALADGLPHGRAELRRCLFDEMGHPSNLNYHVRQIRHRLPPGEALVCELYRGTICYRHVRLLVG